MNLRERIMNRLMESALSDVGTGWLSDLEHFAPEDIDGEGIGLSAPGFGSFGAIDLYQLARVIEGIIEEES